MQANSPPQVWPGGQVPPHASGGNPPQVKSVDVSELLLDEEYDVELVVVSSIVDEVVVVSSKVDELD